MSTRRGGRIAGLRAATVGGLVAAAGLWLGCAGPVASVDEPDGRAYVHRRLGYTIDHPARPRSGSVWERQRVDGTDLAFVGPDGAVMSLFHDCEKTAAPPRLLARNLMIGIQDRAVRESGEVSLHGDPGWSIVFDTEQSGVPVRIKAVTLRGGECVFDWVLVTRHGFREPEQTFDQWWQSFARPGAEQVVAGGDS